ncbi:MAG: DUF2752 domain-containing protein [bacterium]|nr:DUF2752 domain-containing protein [bacterium]
MTTGGDLRFRIPAVIALTILFCLPEDGIGISLCPFNFLTGISCPLCGLCRSMTCLMHLELQQSLAYHPLGIPVLLLLILIAATNRPDYLRSRVRLPGNMQAALFSGRALLIGAAVVWIFRLGSELI